MRRVIVNDTSTALSLAIFINFTLKNFISYNFIHLFNLSSQSLKVIIIEKETKTEMLIQFQG